MLRTPVQGVLFAFALSATIACADVPDAGVVQPPDASRDVGTGSRGVFVSTMLDGLTRTPDARIEDAYKWLFQATRGGEHAAPSDAQARDWLATEWARLGPPLPEEPAIEWLRHDGVLVRLNLRPYKVSGGSQDALVEAFVASASGFRPEHSLFTMEWDALGEQLGRSRASGYLTSAEWSRLDTAMKARGYPAIHHSEAYERAYAPAYRVLTRAGAERLVRR